MGISQYFDGPKPKLLDYMNCFKSVSRVSQADMGCDGPISLPEPTARRWSMVLYKSLNAVQSLTQIIYGFALTVELLLEHFQIA